MQTTWSTCLHPSHPALPRGNWLERGNQSVQLRYQSAERCLTEMLSSSRVILCLCQRNDAKIRRAIKSRHVFWVCQEQSCFNPRHALQHVSMFRTQKFNLGQGCSFSSTWQR